MESLEVSAKSVDEAVDKALQQLGARLSEVEITILSEGRAGILGIGAEDARIRVTKLDVGRSRMSSANFPPRPPAISYASQSGHGTLPQSDDEDDDEQPPAPREAPAARRSQPQPPQRQRERDRDRDRGRDRDRSGSGSGTGTAGPAAPRATGPAVSAGSELLGSLLHQLGFDVEVVQTDPPAPAQPGSGTVVAFDVRGDDLGVLIGRRGQTLSSLQYLVNLMLTRRLKDPATVVVDVEGYRARRYQALRGLAHRMADRVRSSGQAVTLEPMNAAERRIIHLALQDYRDVATQSVGEGDGRKVSIVPKRRERGGRE